MRNNSRIFAPTSAAVAIALVLSRVAVAQVPGDMSGGVVTRFTVTHLHLLSQCVGYLYVSQDSVRYEVVQPEGDKKHSFSLPRRDIHVVREWVMFGRPQNTAEVMTTRGTQLFLLLPDAADLAGTNPKNWGARAAMPVATLLAALQVSTPPATATGVVMGAAPAGATAGAAGGAAAAAQPPGASPPGSAGADSAFASTSTASGGAPPPSGGAPAPARAPARASMRASARASAPAMGGMMPIVTGPASLDEYVFTAPPGWTANKYSDGIVLQSPTYNTGERCLMTMLTFHPAGADLMSDANAAFQGIFRTYELRDHTSDGSPLPTVMIRGTSGQGWDYVMLKRGIGKPNGPGGPFESLQGFVFLARLTGNLAVISGIAKAPLVSSCLGELVGNVWPRFFYSLRFRDWPATDQGPAIATSLTGTWTTASGSVADQYQFAANGRYASAAAVQHYNAITSTQAVRTTQAFFGNGSFALQENTITLTPDAGKGSPETGFARLEQESTDGGRSWVPVLYLLRVSAVDGKDYEVRYLKTR